MNPLTYVIYDLLELSLTEPVRILWGVNDVKQTATGAKFHDDHPTVVVTLWGEGEGEGRISKSK